MDMIGFRTLLLFGALAGIAGVGFTIYHKGVVAERTRIMAADKAALEAEVTAKNKISADLEKVLAERDAANQKLKESLDEQVAHDAVYHECRVPADGVRSINAALSSAAAR